MYNTSVSLSDDSFGVVFFFIIVKLSISTGLIYFFGYYKKCYNMEFYLGFSIVYNSTVSTEHYANLKCTHFDDIHTKHKSQITNALKTKSKISNCLYSMYVYFI